MAKEWLNSKEDRGIMSNGVGGMYISVNSEEKKRAR